MSETIICLGEKVEVTESNEIFTFPCSSLMLSIPHLSREWLKLAQTTPQTLESVPKARANQSPHSSPHEACLEVSPRATIKISQDELWTPGGRASLSNDLSLSVIVNTIGWPHKS